MGPGFQRHARIPRPAARAGAAATTSSPAASAGWAAGPSAAPRILPLGLARKLPAGADIVSTPTFTPLARRRTNRQTLGLYFTDKKNPGKNPDRFQVPPVFGSISGIDIPAGESNYELTSKFTTPVDIDLIGVGAHMHYIGHTAKAHATFPDGTVKSLFYIDDWDFNWQGRYTYDQPIRLPAGTTVEGTVSFDNSAHQPANPSTPRAASSGDSSHREMGSVIFSASRERGKMRGSTRRPRPRRRRGPLMAERRLANAPAGAARGGLGRPIGAVLQGPPGTKGPSGGDGAADSAPASRSWTKTTTGNRAGRNRRPLPPLHPLHRHQQGRPSQQGGAQSPE
ncbi:MAG: hypothetical protein CM1200mP34_3350 [Verrucomicrobiales bacterium]|nr:MAG: hypothetical protein CM1200mP34_3350 [Verrucomicrobiales bacterium]